LVTDGAPALALGTEKGDPDTMNQPPRPPSEPIINRMMRIGMVVQTITITCVSLAAYLIGLYVHPQHPEFAETMAFVTLSLSELPVAYTARSERYPLIKVGIFSNRNMNLAVLSSTLLLLAVVYVPFLQPIFNTVALGWSQWELVIPFIFIPAIAAEVAKYLVYLRRKPA
jgi:Ca2+-transporting ATPase